MFMLGEQGQKMRRETYIWVQRDKIKNCGRGAVVSTGSQRQHEAGRAGAQGESCG